jgi:hypothetical protein
MHGTFVMSQYLNNFLSLSHLLCRRFVLGTCLQAMGAIEKAADAYVTSIEYQQYLPLRDFSDVLY